MKVEVIEKRANQVRDIKCPVCHKEATIVIEEGRTEGSIHCWFCSSLLGWSIEDEVRIVEKGLECPTDVPEVTPKERKEKAKREKTT